jgi:hypothetical protein
MAADETPDAPRYVITGGGTPTPEQLAALAVAMTPVAVPEEDDGPRSGAVSLWGHAAILEGVGHRTFVAMPDLAAGRFPLG